MPAVNTPDEVSIVDVTTRAERMAAAMRRRRSLPLFVIGLGTIASTLLFGAMDPLADLSSFLPVLTFFVLWLAVRIRSVADGVGVGREGYGFLVILGVLLIPVGPLVGPAFVLGLGLVILGWRGRDNLMWRLGAVIGVGSALANGYVMANAFGLGLAVPGWNAAFPFLGLDHLLIVLLGLGAVVLGIRAWLVENQLIKA